MNPNFSTMHSHCRYEQQMDAVAAERVLKYQANDRIVQTELDRYRTNRLFHVRLQCACGYLQKMLLKYI